MKRILMTALMLVLALAAPAMAEEPGVIVQSSCSIVQSGEHYLVYCFAQVHNSSEGTFQLISGDEEIAAEEISRLWPDFLAPGEDGYLMGVVPFESMPQVTGLNYDILYLQVNSANAGTKMDVHSRVELNEDSGVLSVICEMVNPVDAQVFDPAIAIGLYTDAGQMVYADGRSLKDVGMTPGGSLMVRFEVEPALVEQWMSYGVLPTQVQAHAMLRAGLD